MIPNSLRSRHPARDDKERDTASLPLPSIPRPTAGGLFVRPHIRAAARATAHARSADQASPEGDSIAAVLSCSRLCSLDGQWEHGNECPIDCQGKLVFETRRKFGDRKSVVWKRV